MLRKIALGLGIVLALGLAWLAIGIARQPERFHVERSITIAAPPERAFAHVNDFRAWRAWSPYEARDPQLERHYEGPAAGEGAVYAWSGNDDIGAGRMTILESDAPSVVTIRLEFFRPFEATNAATFRFVPAPGGSTVTWAMDGPNTTLSKAISLVLDMDAMVGADFETGLAALKRLAESGAVPVTASAAN